MPLPWLPASPAHPPIPPWLGPSPTRDASPVALDVFTTGPGDGPGHDAIAASGPSHAARPSQAARPGYALFTLSVAP